MTEQIETATRYSLMKAVIEGLAEIDVTDEKLPTKVGKLRREAKRVLAIKEAPRNADLAAAQAKGKLVQNEKARSFKAEIMPIIEHARSAGHTTTRALAKYLNDHDIKTARGGQWSSGSIVQFINRPD